MGGDITVPAMRETAAIAMPELRAAERDPASVEDFGVYGAMLVLRPPPGRLFLRLLG